MVIEISTVDQILLSKNGIKQDMVEKITEEKINDKESICCYIKEPDFCIDGDEKLTRPKSKRRGKVIGLGIDGTPFYMIYWIKYFKREQQNAKERRNKRVDYDFFYRDNPLSDYSKQVYRKVITFHIKNYTNADIVDLLKGCYGVEISEGEVRRMIKHKHENIKIPEIEVKTVGVDEMNVGGINRECTVLQDLDRGLTLGITKRKTADRLRSLIKKTRQKGINFNVNRVVRDLYKQWDTVLKEEFGETITIMVDRFHAVKRIQKKLYDNVYVPLRKEYLAKAIAMEGVVLKKG